jgi:hypothetical protein
MKVTDREAPRPPTAGLSRTPRGPIPLTETTRTAHDSAVLRSGTTKRVFHALANAVPEDGWSAISALNLRRGWGNVVDVRVHTPLSLGQREEMAPLQLAIEVALAEYRHRVEIIWESFG